MTNFQTPPRRTSIDCVVVVKPSGPHQWPTCAGSVKASNTSSRGASIKRVTTISRSAATPVAASSSMVILLGQISEKPDTLTPSAAALALGGLQLAQVILEAIDALLP